jgi:hypothetical protein
MCDVGSGSLIESRYEFALEKNYDSLAAGVDGAHHGGISIRAGDCRDRGIRGQILLQRREVLQIALLLRARAQLRASHARIRP